MVAEIYTRNFCGYCFLVKNILKNKRISFLEINLDIEPDKIEEMTIRSKGRTSVPQVFISGFHVGGHSELSILEKNGGLESVSQDKNFGRNG